MDDSDDIIDLIPAPPAEDPRVRHGLGGRRWGGVGRTPAPTHRVMVPAALAVVLGVAGAAVSLGAGNLVPRSARTGSWLATGGAAGLCGVLAVHQSRRGGAVRVMAYEHGLVYSQGGGPTVVRWRDVTAVAEQRFTVLNALREPVGRVHTFRFTGGDGAGHEVEVGGIADSNVLAGYVHQGTLAFLVPRAEADLAAGRAVPFGALAVAPPGLTRGPDFLPWGQLASVEVIEGRLVIGRRHDPVPWHDVPTWEVPNVHLLLNLIEAKFYGPGADRGKDESSRYSLLERFKPGAGVPRIGY